MTNATLLVMGIALLVFTLPIVVGWRTGTFELQPVIVMLSMDLPVWGGWWLARRGHWRWARCVPPALFFLQAIYATYTAASFSIGGLLFSVIAILLTAMLQGVRAQWYVLGLCLSAYLAIGWTRGDYALDEALSTAITVSGSFVGIALSLWLFTTLLQRAATRARTAAAALAEHVAALAETNVRLEQEEEALRVSLQTSADIVAAIPAGLFIYQYEPPDRLLLLDANPEAERLTGIGIDAWRGKEFNEIWPRARELGVIDAFLPVVRTGKALETEDLYYQDDRIKGAYRIRVFCMPGERLGVAFEDITARMQAKEERERLLAQIQEQARQVQQIVDTVPEGVLLLDAERRVILANPAAQRDLAALAAARVGDVLERLGAHPLAGLLAQAQSGSWHEIKADERTFQVIARPVQIAAASAAARPDGLTGSPRQPVEGTRPEPAEGTRPEPAEGTRPELAEGTRPELAEGTRPELAEGTRPEPAEGTRPELAEGWVLVIRDMTREREMQERVRQQERLAAIGQLAGGIAHDFNNLLTAIRGYTQFALDELFPGDPIRADLQEARDAADRAAALIRQLLAFSRKQVLQPRVLDLNAAIADMEDMLKRLIGENIALRTAPAPSLGRVMADPSQIEQVVMNLVVNARDAMPRGGQLVLETENVVLDDVYAREHLDVKPGTYVMLAVSDTGVGMDGQVKARLFEPFFTTKEDKGTGLGLATVHGIVKQSDGHVEVYSEPGIGTTFKVYLPRIEELSAPADKASPPAALPRGLETILLAEDEELVRQLACRILERQGYRILMAPHPDEALRLSAQYNNPIDLLITDVVMPGMGGPDLAERVTASRPGTRVLYISGYTDDAIAHHVVPGPGAAFLEKPFTPQTLALKVREVLDGPRYAPGGR